MAREKTVLAEYTATSGNFPTVTRVLLAKIPSTDGRMSYVYDKYVHSAAFRTGLSALRASEGSNDAFCVVQAHFPLHRRGPHHVPVHGRRRPEAPRAVPVPRGHEGLFVCLSVCLLPPVAWFVTTGVLSAQTRFKGTYGDRGQTAIAFAMNDEFQHEIRRIMVGNGSSHARCALQR